MIRDRLLPVVAATAVATAVAASGVLLTAQPAAAVAPLCSTQGLTVSALHGPNFYIDTSSTPVLRGAYAGYQVRDTSGAARNDLWVSLTGFTGGSVALGSGQPSAQQIATLGGGASASRFFYLTAQAQTATAQQHTVGIWQGRPDLPGSAQLCADPGGFAGVEETIKAAANKLTAVTVPGGTPRIGGTFTVTVTGDTGTIGSGSANDPQSFWMSPAASGTWPAGAYRLVGTSLTLSGLPTYTDTLRVSNLSSASKSYTAVYTFRAVGFTTSATGVLPVQQIASGTQIKHTDLGSVASLPAISPSTNDLTVGLTATPPKLPDTGGTATYRAAVTGSAGAVLDSFTATVPAGATVVPGSVAWNGVTVADGVTTGGSVVFPGPFALGAGSNGLTYDLALPAVSGNRVTSIVATVGSATIDTTLSLTDNAPATSTVNVNTFPVAAADTLSVGDNRTSTVAVLGNDTDADGDPLAVTAVTSAANGTVTLSGGVVSYTPAGAYTGPDALTYDVSDGRGGTATGSVALTVAAPSGIPPQAVDDTAAATAGTAEPIDVLVNDTGQQLAVTAVTNPGHGAAAITGGGTGVRYTATAGYSGSDSFTYTVTDLGGVTSTGTVTVTVTAPVVIPATPLAAVADQATTAAGVAQVISPLGNDTGDGPLTLQTAGTPAHGTADVSGSTVTYTPDSDFWGTDSFTYTVADAHGAVDTGTVTVTVTAGPAPADDTATVPYGTTTGINVLANDPAGASLAEVTGAPAHGSAGIVGGTLRYTPTSGYSGTDTLTYRLTGGPATAAVTITVATAPSPVLPGPAPADDTVTATAGGPTRIDVLSNDNGSGLTVAYAGTPGHGTAEVRGNAVWYTPAAAYKGQDSFSYTVRDGNGRSAGATVRVTVPNAAPRIAAAAARTVTAGESVTIPFTVTDANDDALALTAGTPDGPVGAADRVRATVTGTRLAVRTDVRFSGTVTVPVRVSDGAATATTELTVTVLPVRPPAATAGIGADPQARRLLAAPTYADGRPVSRSLSGRVDSEITWRVSPATNALGYRVTVNGRRVCTVPTMGGTSQMCRVPGTALDRTDTVLVTTVGAGGTLSEPTTAAVTPAGDTNRLLAVVYFPVGDFALDATARRVLATVAGQARTYGFGTALMIGHTDSDGTAPSNTELSRQRAMQVAAYFRAAYPGLRAQHDGRGEADPARPNTTSRNKAANRRVEIYIG
ncbi:Ig-like domain-containing protein [Nucisporomicrobium flavum]|uniref:Ig-like domain-containing protein n=1 Tax=Nucisporomicrobium flavum TaxID=2785915 RepID=UPI0018F4BF6B|nr:Ig-like domain-containing protein [Nucisporomicrobium flavum]